MGVLVELKTTCKDFEVEYEVESVLESDEYTMELKKKIQNGLTTVDTELDIAEARIAKLNSKIDRLTNHADGVDYMIAAASGVLAAAVDILFVGEFSLERAQALGSDKINAFVMKVAKQNGYHGNTLSGAVKKLEDEFPIPADMATGLFGGGLQHHLRDFAHHPTVIGLFFSLLTQFTRKVYGTNKLGAFVVEPLPAKAEALIGKDTKRKIILGVVHWFMHMVSDVAGSSGTIVRGGAGTGLPGPIVSLIKEVSSLGIFNKEGAHNELSLAIAKLFNGTSLGDRDEAGKIVSANPYDLRTELGMVAVQAIPVLINESIVRAFYFIRRLRQEIKKVQPKSLSDLKRIDWASTFPFKNRTVIRMLTISSGVFTAIDLADAAIEGAVKSGGTLPGFLATFIVKVNFVGVGRCALAVTSDIRMGVERSNLRTEHIKVMNEKISLLNAKVYYKQAEMWIAAEETGETITNAYLMIAQTMEEFAKNYIDIKENLQNIRELVPAAETNNPGLTADLGDILEWG